MILNYILPFHNDLIQWQLCLCNSNFNIIIYLRLYSSWFYLNLTALTLCNRISCMNKWQKLIFVFIASLFRITLKSRWTHHQWPFRRSAFLQNGRLRSRLEVTWRHCTWLSHSDSRKPCLSYCFCLSTFVMVLFSKEKEERAENNTVPAPVLSSSFLMK